MFLGLNKVPVGAFEYMVVGLGNPGREYETTRHNMGFACIDRLCAEKGTECKRLKFKSMLGEAVLGGKRCLLVKPQTFMNLSGQAVVEIMQFYKLPPERVIVIFDDISLDVGRMRIRAKGSDGGHNGMKNIIYLSGSDRFPRIKIGVGQKPHPDYDLKNWVLSGFQKEDAEKIDDILSRAVSAVECIISADIETAMGRFNC